MVREGLTEKVEADKVVRFRFENVGKLPPPVLQVGGGAGGQVERAGGSGRAGPCHGVQRRWQVPWSARHGMCGGACACLTHCALEHAWEALEGESQGGGSTCQAA